MKSARSSNHSKGQSSAWKDKKSNWYAKNGIKSEENSAIIGSVSILGINTATNKTELALIEGSKVLYENSWDADYNEAEKVLPAIKTALKKTGKLEKIFVVQGPGAFTGLRIGITIANALAYIEGIPLISCSTFHYLKAKIKSGYETTIMLKAGGGYVALLIPDAGSHQTIEFEKIKIATEYVLGDMKKAEKQKYSLPKNVKWLPESAQKKFSEVVIEIIANNPKTHKIVMPIYLKPPHITKSKKEVFA